ncbi:MAG: TonB-dependent receptor, partial [Pseudomonadota bacterium]
SVGKRMIDVPEHMFNVGADLECGPFGAMATGRYVGKRYSTDNNSDTVNGVQGSFDPYFTVDLKLRYKVTSWATASLSVTNLFDEKYYSSSLAPGRSAYGELSFNF